MNEADFLALALARSEALISFRFSFSVKKTFALTRSSRFVF